MAGGPEIPRWNTLLASSALLASLVTALTFDNIKTSTRFKKEHIGKKLIYIITVGILFDVWCIIRPSFPCVNSVCFPLVWHCALWSNFDSCFLVDIFVLLFGDCCMTFYMFEEE